MPFKDLPRRHFLTCAASLIASSSSSLAQLKSTTRLLLVGAYSSPLGPEGSKGNGQGIYLFKMNTADGSLQQRAIIQDGLNPSWLALDHSKKFLYVAQEIDNYAGAASGAVTAFSVDQTSGYLTKLNTVSSGGAGPAHLSVHPSGKYVFVANYAGGSFAVLPVHSDGRLGDATDVKAEKGAIGPAHAASAPSGSFAVSGHDHTHGHMIEPDPSGRFVLGADLALDRINIWKFDPDQGKLTPNSPEWTSVPPGDGPRHFVFHPNGRWFYSLQEEGSTLLLFDYDAERGRLTQRQTISTLPPGFGGTNFTSEIRISPNARFLYAANRLHDTIARFAINPNGTLHYLGETWTRGDYPRSFTIDPTGRFLYCCNQRSDAIATFDLDPQSGDLAFTGRYTPVGTPAIVVFLS